MQSVLIYDGVHMTIQRVAGRMDMFNIIVKSSDLSWQPGKPQKLITKINVVAATFDKKGNSLQRAVKISTLQVDEGSQPNTAATPTVNLYVTIPTKSPATRIRFLVQNEATRRIGALNFLLDTNSASANQPIN
jgi:hypothetical protein